MATRSTGSASAGPVRTRELPCAAVFPTTQSWLSSPPGWPVSTRPSRRDRGRDILTWIRDNPRVVSKELAALLDRDLLPMKVDIRKLKAQGLTISHDVGYELSPRGAAYLDWLERRAAS